MHGRLNGWIVPSAQAFHVPTHFLHLEPSPLRKVPWLPNNFQSSCSWFSLAVTKPAWAPVFLTTLTLSICSIVHRVLLLVFTCVSLFQSCMCLSHHSDPQHLFTLKSGVALQRSFHQKLRLGDLGDLELLFTVWVPWSFHSSGDLISPAFVTFLSNICLTLFAFVCLLRRLLRSTRQIHVTPSWVAFSKNLYFLPHIHTGDRQSSLDEFLGWICPISLFFCPSAGWDWTK